MVVLRCTQTLLARVKPSTLAVQTVSSTRLGDWYGNELRLGRQQHLLFVSGRTRLAVVLSIRAARRLATALPDPVCDRLGACGVPADLIEQERRQMAGRGLRTDNRSVLGTMNDYEFMAQTSRDRGRRRRRSRS
jgi:hypothetical protein